MYTRNYYNEPVALPSDYDGIALRENQNEPEPLQEDVPAHKEIHQRDSKKSSGGFLEGLFGNLHIGLPSLDKLGYEEILIIAVAAFLFFSEGGDKECAVLLILLLLIN